MPDQPSSDDRERERRLTLLLSAYREPSVDHARLAAIGDRLEASLRSAARRRAWWRRPVYLAAAAGVAIACCATGWAMWPPTRPPATLSSAGATVRFSDAEAPLATPLVLPPGRSIMVSGGRAGLRWQDGTEVSLDDGVVIRLVDGGDGAKRLELASGRIAAEVARQPSGRPLRIATPQSEITVLGTALSVESDPAGTRVAVDHGRISVRRRSDGAATAVGAGQVALVGAGVPLTARPTTSLPLRNPGFELPLAASTADGWCVDARNNGGEARIVQDVRLLGERSLLLEQTAPLAFPYARIDRSEPGGGYGHVSVSQAFPVSGGGIYAFRFAWRSHGLQQWRGGTGPDRGFAGWSATVVWRWGGADGHVSAQEVFGAEHDASDWSAWPGRSRPADGRLVAPPQASEAVISFKLTTAVEERSPRVWIDDIGFAAEP